MTNPYASPDPSSPFGTSGPTPQGDATGGVIPYKNPHALIAYYSGIFGLFCCFTPLPLGIIPVVLGIMGLQRRARNPIIKGSVHAWIGIVLGSISTIVSLLVAIGLVIALMSERR